MKIQNIIFIIGVIIVGGLFYKKYKKPASKDSSILVIGTSADYPPYEFIDIKTGEIVGFDIDVVTEIASRLDKKLVIKNLPFTSLVFELISGEIDMIAAGMTPSARRAKFVTFTDTYFNGDAYVIVSRKDCFSPSSLKDLVGKNVVVNSGHAAEGFMAKQEGIHLTRLKDVSLGLVAVIAGSADAFVSVKSVIQAALQKINNAQQFVVVELMGTGDDCSFAVERHNKKLAENIDNVISEMKQDGTLDQLRNKWNI